MFDRRVLPAALFSVLAIALCVAFLAVRTRAHSGFPLEMWSPAIAALLVYTCVERRSLWTSDVRSRIVGDWRRWWIAWMPLPVLGVSFALTALLHPETVISAASLSKSLHAFPGSLAWKITALLCINLVAGPFINTFLVYLGEEIGWRGYLYPRLYGLYGIPGLLAAGIIWGIWHAPMMASAGLNYPTLPWWLATLYFTLFTIPGGIIIFYVYRQTRSIIAAAMSHGVINMSVPTLLFFVHLERLNPVIYGAGLITILLFWVQALAVLRWGFLRDNNVRSDRSRQAAA